MINGVHHTAISTPDIERLTAFYRDVIGFEVVFKMDMKAGSAAIDTMLGVKDAAAKIVMMRTGTSFLELFEFSSPTPLSSDPHRRVVDHGFTHICLNVSDIEAEYQRLKIAGMHFHCPPIRLPPTSCTYGRDPDGNIIELLEVADRSFAFHLANSQLSTFDSVAGLQEG